MRSVLLAAALAVPFLHGCAATCSTEGLSASLAAMPDASPDQAAAMLAGACKTDDGLASWLAAPDAAPSAEAWSAACPGDVDVASLDAAPRMANRDAAYEACDIASTGIVDKAGFAAAGGHPALALAAYRALEADPKVDQATAQSVARALLGEPDLTPIPVADPPTLAIGPDAEAVDPGAPHIVITGDSLTWGSLSQPVASLLSAPPFGPRGRQIQALTEGGQSHEGPLVIAASKGVSARLIERVIASTGKQAATLLVVAEVDGKPHAPHGVQVKVPSEPVKMTVRFGPGTGVTLYDGATARKPVPGCADPGPTLCNPASLPDIVKRESGNVAMQLPGDPDVHAVVQATATYGAPFVFDTAVAPCLDAPPGMVCIPGGPTLAGTSQSFPGEGPALVHESTLYADTHEATVAEYKACVADGACPEVATSAPDDHPMTGLSFIQARFYCTHQGKRLPTQWEFERLATPPGAPVEATCEQVNHGACGGMRAAADGQANAWGIKNILGNAREATSSYPRIRTESCGDACVGWDPLGFCDAAPYCKGRLTRVFKGGSATSPLSDAAPAARKIERKKRAIADLGVRCVADTPILNTYPPAYVQSPPPPPEAPGALSADEVAILDAIKEDRIDEIPECDDGRRGHSQVDCKDPTHYIYPNEDRGFITYPYIENRGGALLGVGSDQNYTFAAIARSELVFLLDYDAIVVHIHRVNQAFIKHEDTPDGFVERWNPENREESLAIIAKEWEGDPMASVYQRTLRSLNRIMYKHYKRTRDPSESGQTSWLRDKAKYDYVKDLWEKGRIRSLKGDMLGPNAMTGVGKALTELGVPMRIYYTSNAPNAWGGHLTPEYKRNSLSFPMDERSIVLQALGWSNEFGQTGHWHFNVQDGPEFQRKLQLDGYQKLWQITRPYRATDDVDLTLTDMPGTWEDAHPE